MRGIVFPEALQDWPTLLKFTERRAMQPDEGRLVICKGRLDARDNFLAPVRPQPCLGVPPGGEPDY